MQKGSVRAEGVYIDEDIVKNNNNTCKVFVINTRVKIGTYGK